MYVKTSLCTAKKKMISKGFGNVLHVHLIQSWCQIWRYFALKFPRTRKRMSDGWWTKCSTFIMFGEALELVRFLMRILICSSVLHGRRNFLINSWLYGRCLNWSNPRAINLKTHMQNISYTSYFHHFHFLKPHALYMHLAEKGSSGYLDVCENETESHVNITFV